MLDINWQFAVTGENVLFSVVNTFKSLQCIYIYFFHLQRLHMEFQLETNAKH